MNGISLLLLSAAACYLYLGVDTIKDDPLEKTNFIFFMICLGAFWWAFSFAYLFAAPDLETAWGWLRLSYPGWIFLPGPTLHACLILTRRDQSLGSLIYPLVYLPGLFFLYLAWTGNITEVTYNTLYGYSGGTFRGNPVGYWSFSLYYLTYILLGNFFVYRYSKKSIRKGEKKKAKIIVFSMFTSIILIYLVGTLLPGLGVTIFPRVPPLMALPWIVGMWFSITRYRFQVLTPTIAAHEILSSIQDLLIMINIRGEILLVNDQCSSFLGYSQEELLHQKIHGFLEVEDREEIFLSFLQDSSPWNKETTLTGKKRIPVQLKVSTIKDREGDQMGALLVFQDLTNTYRLREEAQRRKVAEKDLRNIHQELKKKDQQKTHFLSLISHELRTPLTSILGFARIISKKFQQSLTPHLAESDKSTQRALRQFRKNLDIIISESERLTSLINNVLDITRMERGRMNWKMETLDIQQVIQQAIASTSSLFAEKKLSLIQDLEDNLPKIKGDKDRLIQVVINLLSNAVKFTQEGMVTCQTRSTKETITISIIDTGKGIPEGELETIFQKFRQVKGTTKEGYSGTGLGLPISQEIVEYHGGQIWAESTPGQGSTFSFTLPIQQERRRGRALIRTHFKSLLKQLHLSLPELDSEKKEILVVDDDKNIRQLLKTELTGTGFTVLQAENGQQALKKAKAYHPRLIIMDIKMPKLNGLDTLELLKKDFSTFHIPVIILTVLEKREKALQLGAHAILEKPLNLSLLLWTIQDTLTQRRHPPILLLHEEKAVVERLKEVFTQKGFPVQVHDSLLQASRKKENPGAIIVAETMLEKLGDLALPEDQGQFFTIILQEEKKGDDDEQSTS